MANPIWAKIEAALARLDKPQTWLAEKLGVSDNAVSKWKQSGKISRAKAQEASKLLGINLLSDDNGNVLIDVLDTLPPDQSKILLRQFMYQIEHADDVLTGDQISHYMKAMNKLVKDLEKRKKPPTG